MFRWVPKRLRPTFVRVIAEKGVDAIVGKRCDVIKTGCRGLCANDVLVDIITAEQGRVTYDFVKPEEVEKIIDEHIVNKTIMEKRKAKPYYNQFVDAPDACCHDRLRPDRSGKS